MIKGRPLRIAFASGKGGTGKTLVSTNFADWLSQRGKTLLVDLDVEEPDDYFFIRGETVNTMDCHRMVPAWNPKACDLCGECLKICKFNALIRLDQEIVVFDKLCHGCYACSELCHAGALPMQPFRIGEIRILNAGGVILVEGRLMTGQDQAVPVIKATHDRVKREYARMPVQLFDCPPGTSCTMVAAVREADFIILVTEPTPFGLHDLDLAVESVRLLKKPFGVIINRFSNGNRMVHDYCEQRGIPIITRIPLDRRIAELYSRGNLVYKQVEPVNRALSELFDYLFEQEAAQ